MVICGAHLFTAKNTFCWSRWAKAHTQGLQTTPGGGEELRAGLNEREETRLVNQRPGKESARVLLFVAAQCRLAEQNALLKMKTASYLYTQVISGRAGHGGAGPAQTASQRSGAVWRSCTDEVRGQSGMRLSNSPASFDLLICSARRRGVLKRNRRNGRGSESATRVKPLHRAAGGKTGAPQHLHATTFLSNGLKLFCASSSLHRDHFRGRRGESEQKRWG